MGSTRRLEFTQLDVFTSLALEGNPLAVFSDGQQSFFVGIRQQKKFAAFGSAYLAFRRSCRLRVIPPWARLSLCAGAQELLK